jgi:uncharacterized protein YjbI with pentapeptide repeats
MLILERDTKEIDALLMALNRSAERMQTLWFSFLALTLYFIITALTTTHRMLLLEEAQALPIINLKVPLLPFYVIAPIFYLVLHFYVLMMLVLLARSAAVFDDALTRTLPATSDREQFRMRAENALFLQLLIGARPEREGFNSKLLALIALITLAAAPVVTLIVIQMQFLPYHHFVITWLHRMLVGVDVMLVLLLWRGYRLRQGRVLPHGLFKGWQMRRPYWLWHASVSVMGITAALWLSLYEGRWAGEPWLDPAVGEERRLLVPRLFADRLSLPNETIVGEALLLEKQKEAASGGGNRQVPTRDFRGRNFAYADFSSSDLRGVTFAPDAQNGRASVLRGANLSGAQMQNANLNSAQIKKANLTYAQMQGASIMNAQMQGGRLVDAKMQGANLLGAQMQGAILYGAQMQGATLDGTQMQGASLWRAQMQGADLWHAQMQGATLHGAQMQGALLYRVQMQGADLTGAKMQGADIIYAEMQGAMLFDVQMQGALLDTVNMQGADLTGAQVQNAILSLLLFRTTADLDVGTGSWIANQRLERTTLTVGSAPNVLTDADVEHWIANATKFNTDERRKQDITKRFNSLKGERTNQDKADAAKWQALANATKQSAPQEKQHRAALAILYGDLACADGDGAPYVARGLSQKMFNKRPIRFNLGEALDTFRNRLKAGRADPSTCPGIAGFTPADWRALDREID